MILSSTTQKLQIVLGGAVATANSPVLVDYIETNSFGSSFNVAASNTFGASPVDILAAPGASTQRRVNSLTICNGDSAAISVTIRLNDNGTTYDILAGVTLQPLSALQFTREAGWEVVNPSGGVRDLRAGWVQEFRESGTWYKPTNCRFFLVECVGAGGSGSGAGGGANSSSWGKGYGGGGGKRNRRLFLASDLPATVAVTVAPQTSGGAGGTNADGQPGSVGGSSSFGSYLIAYGGGGGEAPTYAAGHGMAGTGGGGTGPGLMGVSNRTAGGPAMLANANTVLSTSDDTGAGSTIGTAGNSFLGGGGGYGDYAGQGGSISCGSSWFSAAGGSNGATGMIAGGTTQYAGAAGGATLNGGPGGSAGPAGGGNGGPGTSSYGYCGSGGGSGGSIYRVGDCVGGKGGDGGYPGGGGGGGGPASSLSGTATGGAGGKGGAGRVRIMGW